MVKKPRHQKNDEYFRDRPHPVARSFFALVVIPPRTRQLKKELWGLIDKDPFFLGPYAPLAQILMEEDKDRDALSLVSEMYERAVSLIADENGNWPERMESSWIGNLHILYALEFYAWFMWALGVTNTALELYRKLLKMDPDDQVGVRFSILAIRMGVAPSWKDKFRVKKGPTANQALDAGKMDAWFERNAKKFPEEFNWIFEAWKKSGSL